MPVDSYGVGSSLIRGENDFTADVVLVDGVPCAKVGRRLRPNPRLERVGRVTFGLRLGAAGADEQVVGQVLHEHRRCRAHVAAADLLRDADLPPLAGGPAHAADHAGREPEPGRARRRRLRTTWPGCREVKEELQEVVDFLRDPKRFEALGARVPKGILLHGPPGTGKTLLAKAIAHESGASFYSQSASAFVEMFAGLGAARIRELFAEARKHAPAIVFIDELDAVGAARAGHGFNREQDQTLNQLLVELDGFGTDAQVVVMAASNRIQDLDPALLRPGRFDRQLLVSPPDLAGRERDPRASTRAASRSPTTSTSASSPARPRVSPAPTWPTSPTRRRSSPAASAATRSARSDFEAAMERVVAGLQQRRVVSEKEKRILAYHEAGHALMSHLMGDALPVQKVTIVSRGHALGYTLNLPDGGSLPAHEGRAARHDEASSSPGAPPSRSSSAGSRTAPPTTSRRRPSWPLDGVRVRHVRFGHVADDARRQLRPFGGDEAAARRRAGPPDRRRLRGGCPPADEAPRRARPRRAGAPAEGDADRAGARELLEAWPRESPLGRDGRHRPG